MLHLWHVVCTLAALLLSQVHALEFSFSTFSCAEVRFDYALDQNSWERGANVLLVNYQDETIDVVDITAPSGTSSFDPTVITQASRYEFTVALGSASCDVFATDGSCYEAGKNKLFALTISQQATCDGQGTGDADATANLPSEGEQSKEADEADSEALSSAVVPDDVVSTAGALTVSVADISATSSAASSGQQTHAATPAAVSAAPTTATLIPQPAATSAAAAANAALPTRAGSSFAPVLAALLLAAAV